jgi:hypothetical protein
MPSFVAGAFAVAGVIAAAGPVIIHLFNRRRYRTISWAAVDFLREALQRNRRILQLRDLALLVLRSACILLFGLAMGRPLITAPGSTNDPHQPVHAVLVVDNSLSMGYERLDGTLLDEARSRAVEFSERLPEGSRISVVPLCDSELVFSREPYRAASDARDALERIRTVDRSGTVVQVAELAQEACRHAADLPAKRVVFLGDQQKSNWPKGVAAEIGDVPELQIVQVAAENPDNAWIADFRIQDDVADAETAATFLVQVRYSGAAVRTNVEVTLAVEGIRVASETVDLEPGQSRELQFVHKFTQPVEAGRVQFVPATASLTSDRLPADDARHLVVPLVAALPVVFVDQYGADGEDPRRNRYGETFPLRRLLAPVTTRDGAARHLVQVRHITIDQLDRRVLQEAPLVVVAGVEGPGAAGSLLREYVEQGGELLIAAGGAFDPVRWNADAWADGAGVLPVPLLPNPVGLVRPARGGARRTGRPVPHAALLQSGCARCLRGHARRAVRTGCRTHPVGPDGAGSRNECRADANVGRARGSGRRVARGSGPVAAAARAGGIFESNAVSGRAADRRRARAADVERIALHLEQPGAHSDGLSVRPDPARNDRTNASAADVQHS